MCYCIFAAKTKLPLTLPGCLPKFDVFADRFLEASSDLGRQKAIAARTEEATETCCTKSPSKRKRAERYLKLMQGKCDCYLSHSFSWTISLNLWPKNLVVKFLGLFFKVLWKPTINQNISILKLSDLINSQNQPN